MKKQFTLIALSAALAAPAFANGFYVGADGGRTRLEADDEFFGKTSRYDNSWALTSGYQFNDYFAAEMSYRTLSKRHQQMTVIYGFPIWDPQLGLTLGQESSVMSIDHKLTAWEASAVGSLPVSDKFALFGRVGVVHVKGKSTIREGSVTEVESDSKNRVMLGLGARYELTQNISLRSEYIRYAKMDDVAISTLTFGADYRF